uniref:Uncharacterized protein n=1 Tax=Aegilops tauschii subsp. strangulata TaxID=200361 RepID=A0A453NBS9_AEGTS
MTPKIVAAFCPCTAYAPKVHHPLHFPPLSLGPPHTASSSSQPKPDETPSRLQREERERGGEREGSGLQDHTPSLRSPPERSVRFFHPLSRPVARWIRTSTTGWRR